MTSLYRQQAKAVFERCFMALMAVIAFSTLLMPWTRDGTTERNGYALAHSLEGAGLISSTVFRVLLDGLFGLPIVVALACSAILLGRLRMAASIVLLEGLIVTTGSALVLMDFSSDLEMGPWFGLVIGASTVLLPALLLLRREGLYAGNL